MVLRNLLAAQMACQEYMFVVVWENRVPGPPRLLPKTIDPVVLWVSSETGRQAFQE